MSKEQPSVQQWLNNVCPIVLTLPGSNIFLITEQKTKEEECTERLHTEIWFPSNHYLHLL